MQKIHRFIGPWPIATGTLRVDDAELTHQLRSVLRLGPGEHVILGDGAGNEAHCTVLRYERDAVILNGVSVGPAMGELSGRTTLYCAVLKADHFELATQKAAEVGVTEIVPVITAHTIKSGVRIERLQKIAREAAEVAGRGRVPLVRDALPLENAFTAAHEHDVNFFFDPSGHPFAGVAKSVRHAGVWIGPEGGWDGAELEQAKKLGMRVVSLGGLTLRAETAATVAAYLVAHGMKS